MSYTCVKCGSPMNPRETACQICGHSEMDEYRIIREYVRNHPHSNAMQVANATGISISKIVRYIKEGSLTVIDNQPRRGR